MNTVFCLLFDAAKRYKPAFYGLNNLYGIKKGKLLKFGLPFCAI